MNMRRFLAYTLPHNLFPAIIIVCLGLALSGLFEVLEAREIVGRGDFGFYLDKAAFKGRGNRVLQEIYVRIPNDELKFKEDGDELKSKVKLSLLIVDVEGKPVIQNSEEMGFAESDKKRARSPLYFQTIVKRFFIEPGLYFLSYAIEDLEAPKVTVLGMIQGQHKISAVRELQLDIPEIPEDEPSFSQPMYVWNIDSVDGQTVYHPNPPRLYGLYKDTLTVFLELYLPDSLAQEPTFEFKSYIVDAGGEIVSDYKVSLPNPGITEEVTGLSPRGQKPITYPVTIKEDLTKYPAGMYSLRFSFGLGERTLSRVRGGAFSVAWDIRTWETPRRSFHVEARFLLGDEDYAAFNTKSIGEQEQMLDLLWRELDPTPESAENEAYEKFLTRLAYVNDHFSGYGAAIVSDRGRIYMKWGSPNEIVQDVIPTNRETLSEAMDLVDSRFRAMNFSATGSKLPGQAVRNDIIDPRRLGKVGEGGNVGVPYELWIYDGNGDPIMTRDRVMNPDIGMRYLFVDREGYGYYRLESSSSISDN